MTALLLRDVWLRILKLTKNQLVKNQTKVTGFIAAYVAKLIAGEQEL